MPPVVAMTFWLIVLPLALAALGVWQLERSGQARQSVSVSSEEMARTIAAIRPIAAETPNAMLRFEGGRSYPASMALAMVEKAASENDFLQKVSAVRHPLAYLTIAGGILAFLGGAVGILASNLAGRRARHSRDQLVRSFMRLRLLLPFLLAAVMLGLGFAGVGATLFETISLPFWGDVSGNAVKLAFAGIILAGIALYCAVTAVRGLRRVFALSEPGPIVERARIATEQDAPALWSFVRHLASRMQAGQPDTIVIGLTSGFYVTESRVRLLPGYQLIEGRTLHMPAPFLELLDTVEIAAIVGHELAHFVGEDTRYSQRFVPIYSSLQRSLAALYQADLNGDFGIGAGLRLGYHALSRFDTAVAHWSRIREFEADRRGSLASGPHAAASALVRSHVADSNVQFILENAFRGDRQFGANLVEAVAALTAKQGFQNPAEHLEDRQPHPTDSHPPTIQRIQALGVAIDENLLAHATRRRSSETTSFGARAVADWGAFCRDLSTDFLVDADKAQVEYRQELQTAVAGVADGEIVLFENIRPIAAPAMMLIAVLLGAFIACTYLFPIQMGFGYDETTKATVAAILGAGIVSCLALFVFVRHRTGHPLMVLSPETLCSHWLAQPVRWDAVVGYQVHVAHRLALQLFLADGAPLPDRTRFSFYNKVNRKRRMVELDALGIRGMKADAFSEMVGRYIHAAHARRALAAEETVDDLGVPFSEKA